MFGKNKITIVETLKADMEESIRMWKMAVDEGWAEDSHMCLKYIDRLDHSTTIANKMLHENLITHDQYRFLYAIDMDFITWRKENRNWVTEFVDQFKGNEMHEKYINHQRESVDRILGLLSMMGIDVEDEDERC